MTLEEDLAHLSNQHVFKSLIVASWSQENTLKYPLYPLLWFIVAMLFPFFFLTAGASTYIPMISSFYLYFILIERLFSSP